MKKDSPVYKQYLEFKLLHPEHILLFRCGDFYETYGDDAVTCARVLGITLTKSDYGDEYVGMAGFPHHALSTYLSKLIRSGNKVAICDPIPDKQHGLKMTKCEITETILPRKGITPEEAVDSHGTFYAKRWQSNGYYPIEKYVWDENEQNYEQFVRKTSKGKPYWRSWCFRCAGENSVEKRERLLYIFKNNPYILSFKPMKDTSNYDEK